MKLSDLAVGGLIGLVMTACIVGAEDGEIGATSTGKCNISITIPPRVELTPNSVNTPRVISEEPMDVEKKVLGSVIVYIVYPKVN